MVPTEEAIITRQMLYSAFLLPTTTAFAIGFSVCVLNSYLESTREDHYCFCKIALTVNSDPDITVSSRFHCAKPCMENTTTCAPTPKLISDGVLPTYLSSIDISAPGGVDEKLHLTLSDEFFCGNGGSAEEGGATGVTEGEFAAGVVAGCGAGVGGAAAARS